MIYYRHPKTCQERKINGKRAGNKGLRAKRSMMNIPSSWDDLKVKPQRSWKTRQKHQYKIKNL